MRLASTARTALTSIFRLRHEAFWVLMGQLGMAMGVLVGVKILTQVLNPAQFGRLSLANTIVLLIGTNLFGPLGQGFMRFWSICNARGQGKEFLFISNRYAGYLLSAILLLSLISMGLAPLLTWKDWSFLITIALTVGAFSGHLSLRLSVLLAARRRKIVALVNVVNAFLKPVVAVFFAMLLFPSAESVMWGYGVAILFTVCMIELAYGRMLNGSLKPPLSRIGQEMHPESMGKEIIAFSWPFSVWGAFGWMHQSCDRWSLQAFHGPDVVGPFSVIAVLAVYPLIFVSGFLSNLLLPIAYEKAGRLHSQNAVHSGNKPLFLMIGSYVVCTSIIILIFFFFHHHLVILISNAKYVEFSYLLPFLTLSWGLFYLGEMVIGLGFLVKQPRLYIVPKIMSGVVAVSTTFFLSSRLGAPGVVWGLGVSGIFYAVWCIVIAYRLSRYVPENKR